MITMSATELSPLAQRRLAGVPKQYRRLYLSTLDGTATRGQCIKAMCMDCMGWQRKEVAGCNSSACPLHRVRPFRQSPRKRGV
jgi:hypothetical protein